MRQTARFGKGSGCFTCAVCKRQTRDTGDNGDLGLCPEDYEIAGMENYISDNEPNDTTSLYAVKILELQAVIRAKGGKV